ncbi:hypothetical protein STRAU_1753 [Streptomyces aurantiacus JA 4570]|uniref:Uncharacterized protein n=1 Tax=Streptomyces aurantiacus JA 4570 TaxID=1286094 RepID=S4A350_9ACTN|nr:hypothetical protein STRAU_1753 [Streptomyces aurantiacus JA 4570]
MFHELQRVCEARDGPGLGLLVEYLDREYAFLRREQRRSPSGNFWESFQDGLERYGRVPYHGVYYEQPGLVAGGLKLPFIADTFRFLDTYTKDTLDIHFLPADLEPHGAVTRGRPLYYHLEDSFSTMRPTVDTLYVWKTTDLAQADRPEHVEALRLGHFHTDARCGVIAALALLLEVHVPLAHAVRDACEQPARLDAAELRNLLPRKGRRARRAARAWADAFAARYHDREDVQSVQAIIADLQSPRRDRRETARTVLAAMLALTGALGAPHVLTHDVPETYQVIHELFLNLTGAER